MSDSTFDLRDIIKVIINKKKIIITTFVLFVLITSLANIFIAPTFEATTSLRIKQPKGGLANSLLADIPGNPSGTKQLMSTYAEIIKSRTVIQEVIDKTQIDRTKEISYEDMIKRVVTRPVKDTEILDIRVQAGSPEEAQLLTNTLVEVFLKRMIELVRSEKVMVKEFIGERLKESKIELEQAEILLQSYKQEQKIINPSQEAGALLDKLTSIDKMIANNTVEIQAQQAKLRSAEQQLNDQNIGVIADNPLIRQYKAKLSDLEIQYIGLSQKYTEQHPEILAIQAAISETRVMLQDEILRVVNAESASINPIYLGLAQSQIQSQIEISVAVAKQQALEQVIATGNQAITTLPAKEQGLIKVSRDANVAQEIYIMLAKRYEEARIGEAMEPTDVQIIDKAILPENPIKPKKMLNIAIAAVLGVFTGLGLAFVSENLNKTVKTSDDVKHYLDLPVLGNIPEFSSDIPSQKVSFVAKIFQFIQIKTMHKG